MFLIKFVGTGKEWMMNVEYNKIKDKDYEEYLEIQMNKEKTSIVSIEYGQNYL